MHLKLKQTVVGVATLAAAAGVLPILAAAPASAVATNNGTLVIAPATGDSNTNFTVSFGGSGSGACNGDSATNGYRVQSFVVPYGTDPGTLTFSSVGPTGGQPLIFSTGDLLIDAQTDINTGNISQLPGVFSFNQFSPGDFAAGAYSLGVACTDGSNVVDGYWTTPISIAASATGGPAQITYAPYVAPLAAPAITSVTAGDGTLTVNFTPDVGAPVGTTYALTASTGGTPAGSASGSGSPLTITGLTNGTVYDLSLTASSGTQTSPAATGTGTPSIPADTGPTVSLSPLTGGLHVTFTPATGNPDDYTVTVSPDPTSGPFSQTVTAGPVDITGLDAGTAYTVTVTPNYSNGHSAPAGTAVAYANSAVSVSQNIKGTRPAQAALVLTQDCGADPTCTVDLGTGVLDTYGQYFVASGQMYPVTLQDYRDIDAGWTVSGDLADTFQSESSTDNFSGQALGWDPAITYVTPALANGYAQTVNEGATIAPWSSTALVDGTAVLMSAPAGSGIGTATATAGLTLWIPTTASAGTYDALLTLSAY